MGLRATPNEDTGVSAAELVFGAPLVLPGQILDTDELPPAGFVAKLRQSSPQLPSRPISYLQMAAKPPATLHVGDVCVYPQKERHSGPPVAALQRPTQGSSGPYGFKLHCKDKTPNF